MQVATSLARLARSYTKSCTDLASLALQNNVVFLQDVKNLAKILQEKNFLATVYQNLARNLFCKFFMQEFSYLARKASFLVQDLQEKYLQDCIFCNMDFTGQIAISGTQLI